MKTIDHGQNVLDQTFSASEQSQSKADVSKRAVDASTTSHHGGTLGPDSQFESTCFNTNPRLDQTVVQNADAASAEGFNHICTKETKSQSAMHGAENDDKFYPEGGLRAWLVVFGSFCGMTASFGIMNTV